MRYEDGRTKIKSGDVLAWSHRGWNSWYDIQIQMVRMFTRSEYSHVGVAWVVGGRVFVLESVEPMIRAFPLSMELPCYHLAVNEQIRPYWDWEVEEFALSKIGGRYSKIQAMLAGVGLLKNANDSWWECAEYTVAVLSQRGILPPNTQATPSNVVQKLLEKGCSLSYLEK